MAIKLLNGSRSRRSGSLSSMCCAVVATIFFSSQMMVGSVLAETIDEALSISYSTNPTLIAAREELKITDEGVNQALANWRPKLVANANVARTISRTVGQPGTDPLQDFTTKQATLTLEQNLFRGGKTISETASAKFKVRGGQAQLHNAEQNVLLESATAYMNVLQEQAILELQANNIKVLERQLEAVSDRFEVGELTRTDVAQAESRLARARADYAQAFSNYESAKAIYEKLVGIAAKELLFPEKRLEVPEIIADAVHAAQVNNPTVGIARFNYLSSKEDIDTAFGDLLPNLNFTTTLTSAIDPNDLIDKQDSVAASLNLTVPIYQQGVEYSKLRQTKDQTSQRFSQYIEARRTVIDQAIRTWEGFKSAKDRIDSFVVESASAKVALEGVSEEARVGARTVLDVLDAEQEALDAEVNLVKAKRDMVVAEYQVYAAMGQLTAQKLNLPVPYYDYTAHYDDVSSKWIGMGRDLKLFEVQHESGASRSADE